MGEVDVHARLQELVERRAGRAAPDEPGLEAFCRRVGERTLLPDVVAVAADQVRPGIPVGLRVDEEHGLTDVGRHGVVAGQPADAAVHHDVGRGQRPHDLESLGHRVGVRLERLEVAVGVARDVEVLFADVVGLVVVQRIAVPVLETVSRQHHDRAVHAGHHVVRDHLPARRAVVDVRPRLGRLPAEHDLLARLHEREAAAAQRPRRRMEIDVVGEDVSFGILQREFDVVALVADHQGARNGTVERERVDDGAVVVDLPLVLDGREFDLDDLGATGCHDLVGGRMRRGEELLFHPRQVVHFGGGGGVGCHGHHHRVDAGRGAKCTPASPEQLTSVHVEHG